MNCRQAVLKRDWCLVHNAAWPLGATVCTGMRKCRVCGKPVDESVAPMPETFCEKDQREATIVLDAE